MKKNHDFRNLNLKQSYSLIGENNHEPSEEICSAFRVCYLTKNLSDFGDSMHFKNQDEIRE